MTSVFTGDEIGVMKAVKEASATVMAIGYGASRLTPTARSDNSKVFAYVKAPCNLPP
jgi:hypothetical protein